LTINEWSGCMTISAYLDFHYYNQPSSRRFNVFTLLFSNWSSVTLSQQIFLFISLDSFSLEWNIEWCDGKLVFFANRSLTWNWRAMLYFQTISFMLLQKKNQFILRHFGTLLDDMGLSRTILARRYIFGSAGSLSLPSDNTSFSFHATEAMIFNGGHYNKYQTVRIVRTSYLKYGYTRYELYKVYAIR